VPKGQTYQEPMGGTMRAGDSLQAGGSQDTNIGGNTLDTSTGRTLQGGSSLQGSSDASLGGTIQTGSMQRDMGEMLNEQRTTAIPVVQEDLKVGKREVQRGGVRVFSRVVETPVNESVNLREEHVSVERRPVDQPISTADSTAFKEQSIEMREKAEEAVVQKSARVVEEVVVGKETSQRQENIRTPCAIPRCKWNRGMTLLPQGLDTNYSTAATTTTRRPTNTAARCAATRATRTATGTTSNPTCAATGIPAMARAARRPGKR
jgi:uncharacterized protein (TIGR02271 family)